MGTDRGEPVLHSAVCLYGELHTGRAGRQGGRVFVRQERREWGGVCLCLCVCVCVCVCVWRGVPSVLVGC